MLELIGLHPVFPFFPRAACGNSYIEFPTLFLPFSDFFLESVRNSFFPSCTCTQKGLRSSFDFLSPPIFPLPPLIPWPPYRASRTPRLLTWCEPSPPTPPCGGIPKPPICPTTFSLISTRVLVGPPLKISFTWAFARSAIRQNGMPPSTFIAPRAECIPLVF